MDRVREGLIAVLNNVFVRKRKVRFMNPILCQADSREEELSQENVAPLIYLCRQDVEEICRDLDPIALMKEVFRLKGSEQTILPDEAYLAWKTARQEPVRSLNMPAYVGGSFDAAGTKIINSNLLNTKRGLPRASGLTLLFDQENVGITCVMEGAYISALRTASVSTLSIDLLANHPVKSAAIIGAGVIGAMHLELIPKVFPSLEQVTLFDLNRSRAEALARKVSPLSLIAEVVSTAEEAVRPADAVVTTTTVTSGYLQYCWLKPGAVVVNVSLDDLLPEVFLQADKVFVDDWNLVQNDSRRLLGKMYRAGLVTGPEDGEKPQGARRVDGELCDLVVGRHPGRGNAQEIMVVNPFGLAIEDIAFAAKIVEIARKRRIGILLKR
jgi:N-[(2S)-2-amino-2-carboxyethyl]-L-glutamate dehydrogenase